MSLWKPFGQAFPEGACSMAIMFLDATGKNAGLQEWNQSTCNKCAKGLSVRVPE